MHYFVIKISNFIIFIFHYFFYSQKVKKKKTCVSVCLSSSRLPENLPFLKTTHLWIPCLSISSKFHSKKQMMKDHPFSSLIRLNIGHLSLSLSIIYEFVFVGDLHFQILE